MKCVAQMPKPVAVAATQSQTFRIDAGRPADMVEEIDRGEGCQQADDRREHDQTQIVFLHDAGIDFQHKSSPTTAEITQGCKSSYFYQESVKAAVYAAEGLGK